MVIESSVRQAGNDPIFKVAGMAKKRCAEIGKDKVINATIGALMEDNGDLVAFDSVYSVFRNLPNSDIASYAAIAGDPAFLEKVQYACFKNHRPKKGYIRAVATPGGTGAVRHAIDNYSGIGDQVLIQDWFWAPYQTIAEENHRKVTTFEMFDAQGNFNTDSYKSKMIELLEKQGRVLSILNTPAHNPTGYSISDEEWTELADFYTETANAHPDWKIIILCDIAYIDFAGADGKCPRKFMEILSGLPENVMILYAYSASKGYTMYGLRNGALLCVAPTEELADEFFASCSFANRGTWSNGTHSAMLTLAKINSDSDLQKNFEDEQKKYRDILGKRAAAFLKSAKEVDLPLCNYRDGFFISIPCNDPAKVRDELIKDDFFIVALKKGLRFAPCAVSEEKCQKAPALIKKALDAVEK